MSKTLLSLFKAICEALRLTSARCSTDKNVRDKATYAHTGTMHTCLQCWTNICYVCIYMYILYNISCLFKYELICNTLIFAFTFLIHFFPYCCFNNFVCMLLWSMCLHTIFIRKKDQHLSTKH